MDLLAIRKDMATKRDVDGNFRDLRADVKTITEVMVSKADLANTLRAELDKSSYAKQEEVNDLRTRVHHLEEKLGIRHAA